MAHPKHIRHLRDGDTFKLKERARIVYRLTDLSAKPGTRMAIRVSKSGKPTGALTSGIDIPLDRLVIPVKRKRKPTAGEIIAARHEPAPTPTAPPPAPPPAPEPTDDYAADMMAWARGE